MEVPLQPEKEAQLAQITAQRGLKADELAQQVLSRYLEDDTHFIEVVNLGLAAAERGEFDEHEEVGSELKKMHLRWTTPGSRDLYRIVQRIQQDNVTAASQVANTLYYGCGNLKRFPYRGREGRIEGTRSRPSIRCRLSNLKHTNFEPETKNEIVIDPKKTAETRLGQPLWKNSASRSGRTGISKKPQTAKSTSTTTTSPTSPSASSTR